MSRKRPSRREIESLVARIGPDDGLDPRLTKKHQDGSIHRKTMQLCSQIQQTLVGVLADCNDDVLRDLDVIAVIPAAGAGRILIRLQPAISAPLRDPVEWQQHVAAAGTMLRQEVAQAIHRRKVPELLFQVTFRLTTP